MDAENSMEVLPYLLDSRRIANNLSPYDDRTAMEIAPCKEWQPIVTIQTYFSRHVSHIAFLSIQNCRKYRAAIE